MLKINFYTSKKNKFLFIILFSLIILYLTTQWLKSVKYINVQPISIENTSDIYDSFEEKLNPIWDKEMANATYSGSISSKHSSQGKYSYRIELRKTDPDIKESKRSEITLNSELPLEEHVYTFNILLPKGGDEDYKIDPNSSEILAQWHNVPDQNEPYTSPPLSLITKNGHYYINRLWDDAEITSTEQMYNKMNYTFYDLGSYKKDKGKFVEWKFHIKWGWLSSQKPILEIYKNRAKILDCNGLANTTNDKIGIYMKLGIYKWEWGSNYIVSPSILIKRVVYYDSVSVR